MNKQGRFIGSGSKRLRLRWFRMGFRWFALGLRWLRSSFRWLRSGFRWFRLEVVQAQVRYPSV